MYSQASFVGAKTTKGLPSEMLARSDLPTVVLFMVEATVMSCVRPAPWRALTSPVRKVAFWARATEGARARARIEENLMAGVMKRRGHGLGSGLRRYL